MPGLCNPSSLLPALEPLAGAALAINLAYLNLTRFRYREKIRKHAKDELERFQQSYKDKTDLSGFVGSKWYRQVAVLAGLPDNDNSNQPVADKAKSERAKDRLPHGVWWWIYCIVFHHHWDRRITVGGTIVAVAMLILGVADNVCHFTFSLSRYETLIALYLTVLAMAAPMLFVSLGGQAVRWGKYFSTGNIKEFEDMLLARAQKSVETIPVPMP